MTGMRLSHPFSCPVVPQQCPRVLVPLKSLQLEIRLVFFRYPRICIPQPRFKFSQGSPVEGNMVVHLGAVRQGFIRHRKLSEIVWEYYVDKPTSRCEMTPERTVIL